MNISGDLPAGIMIRESPSKASLGRTSQRTLAAGGVAVDSFFDVFIELSPDGGMTWSPSVSGPMLLCLRGGLVQVSLEISLAESNTVRLAWPQSAEYVLEGATNLLPPFLAWTNVPDPIVLIGDQKAVFRSAAYGQEYFRLHNPTP